jgi:hypothetical protein
MRSSLALAAASLLASSPCLALDLTADESRWITGTWPVIVFARDAGLPLDVVVQPQVEPEAPPLALAFVAGRCKLVFTMRGNPSVAATVAQIDPALLDSTLELMAAHEMGHCRRWVDGHWYGLPAGFAGGAADSVPTEVQAERREEAYGDLVGLAWTQQQHPQHYAALHRWLVEQRSDSAVAGVHHDTLAWVQLAAAGAQAPGASIFDTAAHQWQVGLAADR